MCLAFPFGQAPFLHETPDQAFNLCDVLFLFPWLRLNHQLKRGEEKKHYLMFCENDIVTHLLLDKPFHECIFFYFYHPCHVILFYFSVLTSFDDTF